MTSKSTYRHTKKQKGAHAVQGVLILPLMNCAEAWPRSNSSGLWQNNFINSFSYVMCFMLLTPYYF